MADLLQPSPEAEERRAAKLARALEYLGPRYVFHPTRSRRIGNRISIVSREAMWNIMMNRSR